MAAESDPIAAQVSPGSNPALNALIVIEESSARVARLSPANGNGRAADMKPL